jgi:hypothetical protein
MHMSKKRTKVVAIAVACTVLGGGAAFAYWTAGGSGTGSASTSAGVSALTAVQTSVVSNLQPGGAPQTLSGTFLNPNDAPVFVTSVTASISSVTPATGLTCAASNYLIANGTMLVGAEALADDTSTWGGATIAFVNNPLVNQDGCKGAVVNLAYAIV